jgi:hypothetical protein
VRIEVDEELPRVLRDLAVERQHDVGDAQPGRRSRAVGSDVGQDYAPGLTEAEAGGEGRGDRLRDHADLAAPHAPRLAELVDDRAHDVAGGGEPDAFAASALGEDEGIDAHDLPFRVEEGAAAVARIDGRIRLDVDHPSVGLDLPCHRAHHAERHRAVQAERAAEGDDDLALPQGLRVAEGKEGEAGLHDLQEREVALLVDADHLGADDTARRLEDGAGGHGLGARRSQHDLHPARAGHDVRVGDDVAVRADEHARSARLLRGQERPLAGGIAGRVGGGQHLHHGRPDARHQPLDGGAEADEIRRRRRFDRRGQRPPRRRLGLRLRSRGDGESARDGQRPPRQSSGPHGNGW